MIIKLLITNYILPNSLCTDKLGSCFSISRNFWGQVKKFTKTLMCTLCKRNPQKIFTDPGSLVSRVHNIVGECLMLNIPCTNPLLQVKPAYYRITPFSINKCSQMTRLLMSDNGLKDFTESLKILDTTLDLVTLVSPL